MLKHHACLLGEYVPLPLVATLMEQIPQQRVGTGDWTASQYMDAFKKSLEEVRAMFWVRPVQGAVLYTASLLILTLLFDVETAEGECLKDEVCWLYAGQEVGQCLHQ
jgi:pyridoxal/pyridoxine/pyridoxamine kinase